MKNKPTTILSIFVLYTSFAMAQVTDESKTTFAVLGGINFQNLNGKDATGEKLENKLMIGYHLGFNVQIPLAPEFYFQPGLMLSTKGAKTTFGSIKNTIKISYIEMPLNLVYKALLGKGHFMLGFGPYLGYGIKGRVFTKTSSGESTKDIKFKSSIDSADADPHMKAFDAGANIFAGYELASGMFFQLNTQLGLVKINTENKSTPSDKTSMKNTGFGLSVGYRF